MNPLTDFRQIWLGNSVEPRQCSYFVSKIKSSGSTNFLVENCNLRPSEVKRREYLWVPWKTLGSYASVLRISKSESKMPNFDKNDVWVWKL